MQTILVSIDLIDGYAKERKRARKKEREKAKKESEREREFMNESLIYMHT